ncbi:MAG: CC/Se motif family (seleno)protein [Treponema sp.]
MQPTVFVGSPNKPDRFDTYEDNEITVYVQKDLEIPSEELLITTATFLWFEKLTVVGMI